MQAIVKQHSNLKLLVLHKGYSDCSFILVFRSCKLLIHVSILIQQTVQSCSNSTQTIQNFCSLLAGGQSSSLKCDNFFSLQASCDEKWTTKWLKTDSLLVVKSMPEAACCILKTLRPWWNVFHFTCGSNDQPVRTLLHNHTCLVHPTCWQGIVTHSDLGCR